MFDGAALTVEDDRQVYGENRFIAAGSLEQRRVTRIWTLRNDRHRIISVRKANEWEHAHYGLRLGS